MINLADRSDQPEIMDSFACSKEDLAGALRFLKITNRFLGGIQILIRHLEKFSRAWRREVTIRILDAGCGLGDMSLAILDWAKRKSFSVEITAVEMIPAIARLARNYAEGNPRLKIIEENVLNGHSLQGTFDYFFSNLFLHHIPQDRQVEALKKLDRLACRGMILSDLERTRAGFYAVSF